MIKKLHLFGGYSFFVNLPKIWIKKNKNPIFVEVIDAGSSLIIKPIKEVRMNERESKNISKAV